MNRVNATGTFVAILSLRAPRIMLEHFHLDWNRGLPLPLSAGLGREERAKAASEARRVRVFAARQGPPTRRKGSATSPARAREEVRNSRKGENTLAA